MAGNRIVVHVAGIKLGQVEIDVDPIFLPPLLYDEDADEFMIPDHFCGIRIRRAGSFLWEDENGHLVEAENHGEVSDLGDEYYLGGIEFTGPITSCKENEPWYFPIPLSYGGNEPQFGAARLIIQLDGLTEPIEFIDDAREPIELPDLYDWEEIPNADELLEELCERVPEFCEMPDNPDDDPDDDESVLGGAKDFQVQINPTVHPPFIGNFKIEEFEVNAVIATNFLRADLIQFKALKALIDEIGLSTLVKKRLMRQLHEVMRYARLVAAMEESSQELFQEALRERKNIKRCSKKYVFITFHRMLFFWYTAFKNFRHYALNLDRAKKDIKKGKIPDYLSEMLEDLEKSVELLEKASMQIYTFTHFIWPNENGRPVFKIKRKETCE